MYQHDCCDQHESSPYSVNEAFQGALVTGDIAPRCGDNLVPKHQQLTEADSKRATICDSNKLSIFVLAK